MKNSTLRNFHVPLPNDLYGELREEADRSGRPATALARDAIKFWLRLVRKAALHDSIAAYAVQHAETEVDLDPELEAASIEHILSEKDSE